MSFIRIRGNTFIDRQGRHLLLHGINLVNKDPAVGYLGPEGPEEFAKIHGWGLNCVRLGVIWDGLEPEPGQYNEVYLQGIDRQIAWAAENDLFVILDMHQDLYSVLYADGAPEWATLTGGQPHISESGVWSDAYFTSPAVHTAWDNFWNNTPALDGIGLQDHYAGSWAQLASRYASNPTVVGYDLMNEPMPGSVAPQAQFLMFAKGAELLGALSDDDGPNAMELAEQWLKPDGRSHLLNLLRDIDLYAPIADAPESVYAEFERRYLMPFYQRVTAAIRAHDSNHIVFMGTTMGSNLGMRSHIEPILLGEDRDPLQAYAPHGYDLVTDTDDIADPSPERVEFVFGRHGETVARLGMPMLVGEWGAYDRHPDTLDPAWHVVGQFEKLLCSETYWAYQPQIETYPCFRAINRPYPQSVPGKLLGYGYDSEKGIFACIWQEEPAIDAPSIIFVPKWFGLDQNRLELSPESDVAVKIVSDGYFLKINQHESASIRQLTMRQV